MAGIKQASKVEFVGKYDNGKEMTVSSNKECVEVSVSDERKYHVPTIQLTPTEIQTLIDFLTNHLKETTNSKYSTFQRNKD